MHLSVLHRIILVATIPLLAFLAAETLTIRSLLEEQAIVREMEGNIPLFAAASTLVDRLQKERGTTILWVNKATDQGSLQSAQAATDKALAVFLERLPRAALGSFSLDGVRGLEGRMREARSRFAGAHAELSAAVTEDYSALVAEVLKLQGAIVNARTSKGLGKVLGGLIVLEYAKESTGRLRALGAAILAHDHALEEREFIALLTFKAEADAGLKSPALVLGKASRQKLDELRASAAWQETERILHRIIQRATVGDFGVAPADYFRVISQKIDDMAGIVAAEVAAVEARLADISAEARRSLWLSVGFAVGIAIFAVGISLYFAITIVRSMRQVNQALSEIAQGEGDLSVCLAEGKDELGQIARDFNHFVGSMAKLVRAVREVSRHLDDTAAATSARAQQMDAAVGESSARANTVAAAAEEMRVNTAQVAERMQEATRNLEAVAAAAEEMSATVQEVAGQTAQARSISQAAAGQVAEVQRILGELVAAAQEIGTVSEAIAGISSQTNLLALNATIEAARAGEAGRGFAVVANEIKELANQTAQATGQIRQRIDGVQGATGSVNAAVERFAQVFHQVGDIVERIAAVIDEQAQAMREMAGSIAKTSSGVAEAGDLAEQNAGVAANITGEIAKVNEAGAQMSAVSRETLASARRLAELAAELQSLVGRFRLE